MIAHRGGDPSADASSRPVGTLLAHPAEPCLRDRGAAQCLFRAQPSRNAAISRLFFSSIIMWPLPWMLVGEPHESFFTPACVRNSDVQWSYGA